MLYFQIDKYRAYEVHDQELVFTVFGTSAAVISLLLLGFVASRYVFQTDFSTRSLNRFYRTPQQGKLTETVFITLTLVLSMFVLALYVRRIGLTSIPLFVAAGIFDSDLTIGALRSRMGNAFEGRYYLYQYFMHHLLQISSFALLFTWLARRSKSTLLLFLISFAACFTSLLLATEKGPVIFYIIGLAVCAAWARTNGFVRPRTVIITFACALGVLSLSYTAFMGAHSLSPRVFSKQALVHSQAESNPSITILRCSPTKQVFSTDDPFQIPQESFHSNTTT